MKKLLPILVVVVVAVFVLAIAKDMIVKVSVEKGTEVVTGLNLSIKSFRVGLVRTLVDIKGLRLENPKGFKDRTMLDMPVIYVDYDLPAIMKGTIHLKDVKLDMQEFVVVKNEKGELNLDALNVVKGEKGAAPAEKKAGKAPEFKIDNLELKIGKVVYKDYSKGGEPSVQEFNVNLNETYQNVDNPQALVSLIVVKALANTSIAKLTNFDVKGLQGNISGTLATAQKVTGEMAAKATETIGKTTGVAKDATKAAQEAVKSVGGLFGK